ncbi:hypothetical protein [Pseudomonas sp. T8]|uniref:c-type cytochrome n=1 Tax=Pseudomonas sp. T8 TaxID=645292 RepID=UPI0021495966|nr:hypothetical protein [Pseudomonas sp. T8]UUT22914.1 hypothetical protein NRG23_02810 [Pseudomonas sp. T8]
MWAFPIIFGMATFALLTVGPVSATEQRQFDYMINCQGCHLADGSGNASRQVPSFPGQLEKFLSVSGGREYLAQVPGSALSGLSDERLAGVLNWMLEEFSTTALPTDFKPFTGGEIHPWRDQVPIDVGKIREELLERIVQKEKQYPIGALTHEELN